MRKKTKQGRRRASSPRPEPPTILPTSYTTSWDLTDRDPFMTRVDPVSPPVAPSRTKPPGSESSSRPRWRPRATNGKSVDPS